MNAVAAKVNRKRWLRMWASAVFFWFLVVAGLLLVMSAFVPTEPVFICHLNKDSRAKAAVTALPAGVKAYKTEYDRWPPAKGIFAILEGQDFEGSNPRKIRFWDPDPNHVLPDGTPTDWWGHPLVFDGIVEDQPRFHSIGKDSIDQHGAEGSDDIVSWHP